VRRKTHLERAELLVGSHTVEDDDTAGATNRDEAGERVDQLLPFLEACCPQDVVAVEQVEGGIRQRAASAPRTPAVRPRR
jgi:hypothetical protein